MPLVADSVRNLASAMVVMALLIAGLALGRDVLIPLTLAGMVAFGLSPLVRGLTSLRIWRPVAVLTTVSVVTGLLIGLSALVSSELLNLASEIDRYERNVIEKVRTVTGSATASGTIARASHAVEMMGEAIESELGHRNNPPPLPSVRANATQGKSAEGTAAVKNVVIADDEAGQPSGWEATKSVLESISKPAAQIALTFLFAVFLLLQYQDLRDRVVRVVGTDRMSDATSAMSEAGTRLSQLFLMQALVNAAFGVVVGLVLWTIGVPNSPLWGLLAGVMRFVPFIGTPIAAIPPLFLAAAVDPSWSTFVVTLTLFVVGEPLMGNVVEPLAVGRKAGISPFAMVASVSFWTLLWGPMGLLLAAPMTTILIVLGKYIDGLELFSVLLGDEPALSREQEFYHRLLSGDALAAIASFESASATASNSTAGSDLVMGALALAAYDYRIGRLESDQVKKIERTVKDFAAHLTHSCGNAQISAPDSDASITKRVLIFAARGEIDSIAARFVAIQLNKFVGCEAKVADHSTGLTALASAIVVQGDEMPDLVVIVTTGTIEAGQLRFIEQRAVKNFGSAHVVILDVSNAGGGYVREWRRERYATPAAIHSLGELAAHVESVAKANAASVAECGGEWRPEQQLKEAPSYESPAA